MSEAYVICGIDKDNNVHYIKDSCSWNGLVITDKFWEAWLIDTKEHAQEIIETRPEFNKWIGGLPPLALENLMDFSKINDKQCFVDLTVRKIELGEQVFNKTFDCNY